MELDQLRAKISSGNVDAAQIFELLVKSQQQLAEALARIRELEQRLGGPPTQKLDEPFSVRAEMRRQAAKARKKQRRDRDNKLRRGRITTAEKIRLAARTEAVFPTDADPAKCWLSHTRVVWRLEDGRAVLVAYEIYRGSGNCYGQVPGVVARSEFSIEIMLAIAWQVYTLGLSFDKVCAVMNFFQSLKLRKSQVDALLNQLSRHWEEQFEILCRLVANSAVVHADETSWSINSVWAFLGEQARVVLFGVHKDFATLNQILDPAKFQGLVVSDNASVYGSFSNSQKCWAHLLRKAIRLTLLEPDEGEYRQFADELLAIYHEACRVQRDGRVSTAGRQQKVTLLADRLTDLCMPGWILECEKLDGPADDYRLLINELMELMIDQELFRFVIADAVTTPAGETRAVSGTNNEAERTLRNPAMARKTGRTNKTARGARRQTVLVSVLESFRCHLGEYTLQAMVAEVSGWLKDGESCFSRLLKRLKLAVPSRGSPEEGDLLSRLIPDQAV